ncbi:hypothetical protein KL905_002943 [Ogataea polymorpha]|nr:hypothetical protein KL908_003097 [Ogataea polymorpha]KAG7900801.1 hypothetical protein KL935_002734 [Ogataea polymorpha]KAG7916578.1 hypothetical protein KL927_003217 [Ogataea polymorpha]KAG7921485.1 hypothetical protein KL905_002943 [Ogataea polymorpha]
MKVLVYLMLSCQLAALPVLPSQTLLADSAPSSTPVVVEKRMKKAIVNKDYAQRMQGKGTSSTAEAEMPAPWLRTIYGSIPEIVTPTVVGGITFSAKPPATTNGLEPWISLKKDGSPKTINPKMKNGKIQNGRPDLKTYFQTATTVTYDKEQLKAHNMADDQVFTEVIWQPEDDTYVSLNPLMRCTPDFYYKKGVARELVSEPFCSPHENQKLQTGKTYFLTWYTRFFENASNVRVHYAFLKESSREKGMAKRDLVDLGAPVKPRTKSVHHSTGHKGALPGTFFSSDWFINRDGYFPIEVDEEWLGKQQSKAVLIAIQPDTVDDEDFNLIESAHVVVLFQKRAVVAKNSKIDKELQDRTGTNDNVYYVIMSVPTVVIIAVFGMYMFLWLNRKHRDLSHLRKPRRSRYGNQGKYNELYAETDIRKPSKQV